MELHELIEKKGKLETDILRLVVDKIREFELLSGAKVQSVSFGSTYTMEYGSEARQILFTDCECSIRYEGVTIGG